MQTIVRPDTQQKLEMMTRAGQFDCDGEPALSTREKHKRDFLSKSVVQVLRPDGPMTVLRTMQTSACEKNCNYCPFRAGRGRTPRISFSPDELAGEFIKMARAKVVGGLFLSSGIIGGGVRAMDPMLATVELLRKKYDYRGYIHLKIMPGAEQAQVEQALRLADRISINLEGANTDRLAILAPQKDMRLELLPAIHWAHQFSRRRPFRHKLPSVVTQFVVGPAAESDHELLLGVDWLYKKRGLSRAYYSAFSPIADTPLENTPRTPLIREHRLYQADWLLRYYGFSADELSFADDGALPTAIDPKLAWARRHLAHCPIEVNTAPRAELLRVPGIGPKSADAILRARKAGRLQDLSHLQAQGAIAKRAAPFVLLNGRRPPQQLSLF